MGNPGHDAAGALLDIWAEVGNTGRGYIIDYICEFTNLANFSTLVRLPFYDVRLHRAGTWPHVFLENGKRMLEFRRCHPLLPLFNVDDHFLIVLSLNYADRFLESKGGI